MGGGRDFVGQLFEWNPPAFAIGAGGKQLDLVREFLIELSKDRRLPASPDQQLQGCGGHGDD